MRSGQTTALRPATRRETLRLPARLRRLQGHRLMCRRVRRYQRTRSSPSCKTAFQQLELNRWSRRAAIERGGGAPFRVYHDHDGFFNTFCQGSLFVSKTNVTFKGDDGNHTFAADRTNIKEVKSNGLVGVQYGAFHLKVITGAKKSD